MMCRISSPAFACQLPVNRAGACAATSSSAPDPIFQGLSMAPIIPPPVPILQRPEVRSRFLADDRDVRLPLAHHPNECRAQVGIELETLALVEIAERLL